MASDDNNTTLSLHERSDSEILTLSLIQPDVFGILVDRYQREFLRKAFKIVRDKNEAEDIVQDVFVKMYRHAKKFRHQEGATFKSWAYKILTNTCFTHCKKTKRRAVFIARADDDMLESFSEGNSEFESMLDINQVRVAIGKIPALLGRMVTLALSGKTQEEIAVLEGVPVGTVRTRLHRAKKEIRKVIP
ncbi:MAG: polymerase sigma factor RpoE [Candidatus Paceibacter sp.]|jgi:RNA polymerase sigma-70 factor (ECF subfamily)|nr:polymerase sigma factor RpoE [Candidatus Paceibacter sp.]